MQNKRGKQNLSKQFDNRGAGEGRLSFFLRGILREIYAFTLVLLPQTSSRKNNTIIENLMKIHGNKNEAIIYAPPRIFIAIFPVIVWLDQRSQWKNYIGLGDGANVVANPVHHRVEAPLSNWSRLDLRVATIDRSELGEGSPSLRPRRDRREGGREEKKKKREIYACRARKTRRFVLAARGGDSSSSARWLSARRSGNAGRGGSTGDRDVIARSGTTARILVSTITFELHFFFLFFLDRCYW